MFAQPPPCGCALKLNNSFCKSSTDLVAAFARLCVETELCRYGMGGNLRSRFRAFCEPCFRATSCTLRGILHFLSLALSVAFKRFKIVLLEFKVSVELNLECEREIICHEEIFMDKDIDVHWTGWVVVLLPYEIGILFMLFGVITFGQVLFFGTLFYALLWAIVAFFRNPKDVILLLIIGSKL